MEFAHHSSSPQNDYALIQFITIPIEQDCQRIIRLKSLGPKTNPALLAREVVEKCDLIHSSQVSDVEQIIYYLKNRKDSGKWQ